ncbi:MAG: CBS domain-containing protein [Nitrosarchaeum sp.]|nr:CBS domain-containing protein [Nitrosarchaeum sp.]
MDSEKSKISIDNFMTLNIKSIQPDINIKDAAKIMYEQHIPSLLVEENHKMIGIITYADIALALTIFDHKPTTQVREIMSSPIISVTSDHSILKAVELMLEKRIHKIPVIDNEKIQGIISATDLMILFSMLSEKQIYNVVKGQIEKI